MNGVDTQHTDLISRLVRPKALGGLRWDPLALAILIGSGLLLLLATLNLSDYPATWFDEGSHLHVPKTLVRFGVYADYSSEGFRHYGPTIGVGPTVLLPIAAVFRLFGVGLLQARAIMVLYLIGCVFAFYRLTRGLNGAWFALAASALLISSRGVAMLEYGRQVLGEVPGLFFVLVGLALWFRDWERSSRARLVAVGLLFGLAMVTKYQYLLVLAPTLVAGWLANAFYYRTAPQRVFFLTGVVAAAGIALWQIYMLLYLGPATVSENIASFREFTSGAALVFSPGLMQRSLSELLSARVYLGLLIPAVAYGAFLSLPKRVEAQRWGVLLLLVAFNLVWYVVASVSWLRYAFIGLAVASIFVTRFFFDLAVGIEGSMKGSLRENLKEGGLVRTGLRWTLVLWFAAAITLPLAQTAADIVFPEPNAAQAMTEYLDAHVPRDALIETWEPEMGFLSDHHYHFPPHLLLNTAVAYVWLGGPSPAEQYDFRSSGAPEYVLLGEFGRWVDVYPAEILGEAYRLETAIGPYELYISKPVEPNSG